MYDAYIWYKGEHSDMVNMLECLKGREMVMDHQLALEKRVVSDQKKLNDIKANKKTITNFWKSKSSKESEGQVIEQQLAIAAEEVEEFKQLINFLTIYHATEAIPKFKKDKAKLYKKLLSSFCVVEITNSHKLATLYDSMLNQE